MSKKKIIAIAISAVVIIGAAVAAVPIVRHFTAVEESTTQPTYEYPTYVPVNNAEEPSTEDANLATTIQQIAQITKNTASGKKQSGGKKTPVTTQKANQNGNKNNGKKGNGGLVDNAIGQDDSSAFLGYKKDVDNDYYYCDDKDCWQKNAGYNEVYDNMAPMAAMFIDQVRIRFTYDHKDWMIQFWKGQYGWLLVGAEIGVYTAPEGTYKSDHGAVNQYICADKEDWLKMQLDCYFSNTNSHKGEYVKIFTRPYDDYWWANGFVKGQLTKYNQPRTELNLKCRITLKTKEMADAFAEGLRVSGFNSAASVNQLEADTYYQDGQDVYVLWSTIYHDCFVGYTD